MTFFFLIVILGATRSRAPFGLAPIAIGLALTLIHLISNSVTNTSVNPARSTGPVLFAGGAYLAIVRKARLSTIAIWPATSPAPYWRETPSDEKHIS